MECKGGQVVGQMLTVDDEELKMFDQYEGIESGLYVKTLVAVTLPDGSQHGCTVYTKGPAIEKDRLYGEWSYQKYMNQ